MANMKPAHGNVKSIQYPLSTIAVTRGATLAYAGTPGNSGYVGPAAPTSAAGVVAISAEAKNGVISGRSALASTTADGEHVVQAYAVTPEARFLAVCSATPATDQLDVLWSVTSAGLLVNDSGAEGCFLIEQIEDATAKTVVGRFVTAHYNVRTGFTTGVGS